MKNAIVLSILAISLILNCNNITNQDNSMKDYSSESTVVGFINPSVEIFYQVVDDMVFIKFFIFGQSNSEYTSFTVPFSAVEGQASSVYECKAIDNGINLDSPGMLYTPPQNENTVSVYKDFGNNTLWTPSGEKSIQGSFWYKR